MASTKLEIAEMLKLLGEARDSLHTCDEYCDGYGCLGRLRYLDEVVEQFIKILREKKKIEAAVPIQEEYPFCFKEDHPSLFPDYKAPEPTEDTEDEQ